MLARGAVVPVIRVSARSFAVVPASISHPSGHITVTPPEQAKYEELILAKESRVVTRTAPTNAFSLTFAFTTGARAETASEKGCARLAAASAFSGTMKRSAPKLTSAFHDLGIKFCSSSDREKVKFNLCGPRESLGFAFEALSEIAFTPSNGFSLENDKSVVRSILSEACTGANISDLLHEAAYGGNSAYGASILTNQFEHVTPEVLEGFRKANFQSGNLVIAANGVTANDIKILADSNLKEMPTGFANKFAATYVGGDIRERRELGGAVVSGIAFPIPGGDKAKSFEVLKAFVSSRLLGGSCGAFVNVYATGGLLGFFTRSSGSEFYGKLYKELSALAKNASGFESAVREVSLNKLLALEGGESATVLVNAALSGQSVSEYVDYSKVTAANIQDAAESLLKMNPSTASFGAVSNAPTGEQIRNSFR